MDPSPKSALFAPQGDAGTSHQQWILCGLLFLATTLNYLDRQTLSILAPAIQKEMGLDNEALGWLFSVFYYSYTIAQFGVGLLLDRANLRWAYGFAVLAWSAAAGLTGTATGFMGLIMFRLLLGIMESANWPAAMRIVARTLPPRDRPLGNGIFTSGTSVGALIAPALILGISAWLGWRWAFAGVASLGALWFVLWAWYSGKDGFSHVWRESGRGTASAANVSVAATYRNVLGNPQFWRVFLVAVLVNPCLYFNVNWLPTYFVQERGLDAGRQLGWILTAIYVGLDIGYITCGFAVRELTRRGLSIGGARRIVFSAATVLLALSAMVPLASSLASATGILVLANMGVGMWISMYLTMAQEVSSTHVSTAAGLLGGSGSFAGAIAMWGVGKVTQQTSSFLIPLTAVAIAAAAAALAGMLVTRARAGSGERA